MSKYRPCRRGESPRPKKSGISFSTHKEIQKGNLRYNKTKGYWEKREEE